MSLLQLIFIMNILLNFHLIIPRINVHIYTMQYMQSSLDTMTSYLRRANLSLRFIHYHYQDNYDCDEPCSNKYPYVAGIEETIQFYRDI